MGRISETLREGISRVTSVIVRVETESRETALGIHLGKVDKWITEMILWSKDMKGSYPEPPQSYVHGLRGRREVIIGNRFRVPFLPVNYH